MAEWLLPVDYFCTQFVNKAHHNYIRQVPITKAGLSRFLGSGQHQALSHRSRFTTGLVSAQSSLSVHPMVFAIALGAM